MTLDKQRKGIDGIEGKLHEGFQSITDKVENLVPTIRGEITAQNVRAKEEIMHGLHSVLMERKEEAKCGTKKDASNSRKGNEEHGPPSDQTHHLNGFRALRGSNGGGDSPASRQ